MEADGVAIEPAPGAPVRGPLPPAILFALVALLCLVSFVVPVVLVARNALTSEPAVAAPSPASLTTSSRTSIPAAATVRVVSASGTAEALGSGLYQVTFTWMLEGAREGDTATVRFFMGSTPVSDERGTLDPTVFTASSGQLRLTTSQDCSAAGWSAELVTLRNQTPQGERTARAAGVNCG